MRECEQLKHALGLPYKSKKAKSNKNDDQNGDQRFNNRKRRPDRRDYHDRRPYLRNDDKIDTIISATTTTITDPMTTVATIATTGVMTERVITVTTSTITAEMISVMTIAARMTTTVTAAIAKSYHHHHHLKGATLTVRFNQPTERSTFVGGRQATKSNNQLRSNAREIGHVNTETPQPLRWSEFPITFSKKDHWSTYQTPGPTSWSLTP
jgi:hypothetical protein